MAKKLSRLGKPGPFSRNDDVLREEDRRKKQRASMEFSVEPEPIDAASFDSMDWTWGVVEHDINARPVPGRRGQHEPKPRG